MRSRSLDAETLDLVLLVAVEVALEPEPLRIALVGEDVGGDPVEEPAIMRGDDGAAGELEQGVLQRAEGLDVEVVRGLIEKQQVAAHLQREGEVQAVALVARQHARGLLLVGPLESEHRDISARRQFDVADLDPVEAIGDDLPDVLRRVEPRPRLVDVRQQDGLADLEVAGRGEVVLVVGATLCRCDDHLEQGGLADAVRADDTDNAVARQRERQVVEEQPVTEALREVRGLDDDTAQARARRDLDLFHVELAGLVGSSGHLLVAVEAGAALRLAGLGIGPHPLELVGEAALQLHVLLALDLEAGGLRLEVGGVVALVGVGTAAVELEDPLGDVVEEVAIMGDGDDGAGVLLEMLLEPLDALGIEVVRRLVEEEQVGLAKEQLA
ncbi:unannotated protein [freshwater metagenome]|uniref:Unannotated protein n=2 Tax=freshwater metagenome TaxID=449393 RepID=A0A6J6U7C5_9ZZZZ